MATKYFAPAFFLLLTLTACHSQQSTRRADPLVIKKEFGKPVGSQTHLQFDSIPYSENDFPAPGRGPQNWNDGFEVSMGPDYNESPDRYCRFAWNQMQNDDGSYNWSAFDLRLQIAIKNNQKFSFGIMPVCELGEGIVVDGAPLSYPLFLHKQMQSEAVKDWRSKDMWVMNWNSNYFISAWKNMQNAVAAHIDSSSFNGVPFKNVIYCVDVRGYGNFGEWHNYPYHESMPAATWPTAAVLDTIIASYIHAFPNYPLVNLIGAFDNEDATTKIPLETTWYALTAKNNFGPIGWRRDNWGDPYNYTHILENNKGSYNGLAFSQAILNRYQTAPVTGEPLNAYSTVSKGGSCGFWDLENEVLLYHASSIGNGNIYHQLVPCALSNIRAAFKACGYRIILNDGWLSSDLFPGGNMVVTLNWMNVGSAPVYEKWNTQLELKSENGETVWSGKSTFNPKLFLPGSMTVVDSIPLPVKMQPGKYQLLLKITDPVGYRKPLPLAIKERLTDGSYLIADVQVGNRHP